MLLVSSLSPLQVSFAQTIDLVETPIRILEDEDEFSGKRSAISYLAEDSTNRRTVSYSCTNERAEFRDFIVSDPERDYIRNAPNGHFLFNVGESIKFEARENGYLAYNSRHYCTEFEMVSESGRETYEIKESCFSNAPEVGTSSFQISFDDVAEYQAKHKQKPDWILKVRHRDSNRIVRIRGADLVAMANAADSYCFETERQLAKAALDKAVQQSQRPARANADRDQHGAGARTDADASLQAALRRQIGECWATVDDLPPEHQINVTISVQLARDGSLISSKLVTPSSRPVGRSGIAVDRALLAVRKCGETNYRLPPEDYELWKGITVTLGPR